MTNPADTNGCIAVTPGEPAGIGPDICIKLAQAPLDARWVVIANPEVLKDRAKALGLPLTLRQYSPENESKSASPGNMEILPVATESKVMPGKLDTANAGYVLETLARAVDGCQSGEFSAMVTGPVHKGIINDAGTAFSGHTEFIANITGGHPVMMLATDQLRVALATTHLPLSQVAASISAPLLRKVIRVLNRDLVTKFGLATPRILVCGLNPHAGEDGHLGREEIEIIEPVLEELRTEGIDLTGPLPADTAFTEHQLQKADAVLAMYHDQGLPVLKNRGFGRAANITLGLPIIRTSVDHGTALELAGTGEASTGSLETAISMALRMSSVS